MVNGGTSSILLQFAFPSYRSLYYLERDLRVFFKDCINWTLPTNFCFQYSHITYVNVLHCILDILPVTCPQEAENHREAFCINYGTIQQ